MQLPPLDQRIRLEVSQTAPDASYGTPVQTWVEFATVWANVQDMLPSKAESQVGGLTVARQQTRVRIRYLAGVLPDMRIIQLDRSNRILQIISGPAELGRQDGMELMAEQYTTEVTA